MGAGKKKFRTADTRGPNADIDRKHDAGKSRNRIKEISYRKEKVINFLLKYSGLISLGFVLGFAAGFILGYNSAIVWALNMAHRYGIVLPGVL